MLKIFLIPLFSFILCCIIIPYVKNFSIKYKLLDNPDQRKKHKLPKSRLGGIGIFFGTLIPVLITALFTNIYLENIINLDTFFLILLGAIIFFFIGIADDFKNVSPFIRLFFQFFTLIIISSNLVGLEALNLSFISQTYEYIVIPSSIAILLSSIFVMSTINAINWIDGMDGLATTITLVSTFSLGIHNYLIGNYPITIYCLSLFGSSLAFLIYNLKKDNIHMGDGGSYFIGYSLSLILIASTWPTDFQNYFPRITFIELPFVMFSLIYFDMFLVIKKRITKKKSIFVPDRSHIHHRLYDLGFKQRYIILILSLLTLLGSVIYFIPNSYLKYFITFYITLILAIFYAIDYKEKKHKIKFEN